MKNPEFVKYEIMTEKEHIIMNAMHQSISNEDVLHIDKFLFWVIKNYNVENSVFLNKYNKLYSEVKK